VEKLDGEKKIEDMFNHFDRIHAGDGQTDGHCMTAKAALIHSIIVQQEGNGHVT